MNAPFVIQAGLPVEFYEPGDFFRILASAAPVDVRFYRQGVEVGEALQVTEGYAERWRGLGFDRFIIASATTQTLQVVARLGSDVFFDSPPVGDTSIISSVPLALDAATLAALEADIVGLQSPLLPASNWNNGGTMGANAPLTIFAAGSNPNGAILWSAGASDGVNGAMVQSFIAKATAPTGAADGDVIAQSTPCAGVSTTLYQRIDLQQPRRIAAGRGLYFISSVAGSAGFMRHARYTLL